MTRDDALIALDRLIDHPNRALHHDGLTVGWEAGSPRSGEALLLLEGSPGRARRVSREEAAGILAGSASTGEPG